MKNIAKCKLCNSIIESFHSNDYVECTCGEISVSGGAALYCGAKHWENFVRLDQDGKEVAVKSEDVKQLYTEKPSKQDLLKMLEDMIGTYENLPAHVMTGPITHYDHCASLILILEILKSE